MIYDRIDLKAIGTWANNFRPTGLVLSFGNNLVGGDKYDSLTNVVLPYGTVVGSTVLSSANCSTGIIAPGGVSFSTVSNVLIPFGIKFTTALTIGGKAYPIGIFKCTDTFTMNTVQLIDVNKKVIFSVHGTETDELIAFNRPTANISRLIMYKDGIGVDSAVFACYSIVFKTAVTLADIKAFNLLHPTDVNPIIIDDGSVLGFNYIIPAV